MDRDKADKQRVVIKTAFEKKRPKLSRKCCYCDRFQLEELKAVKKVLL